MFNSFWLTDRMQHKSPQTVGHTMGQI